MSSRLHLIAVIAALSVAQARAADHLSGYLVSGEDHAPVTSGYGGCVQTSQWTPDGSYRQCAPQPVAMHVSAFDFDSALLRADAGPALAELAKQLTQADYQTVHVVGHADRIGPAKYNRQLSEQRAEAVRDYLVAYGLDGSKIAVSGAGSTKPVTGSQCMGLEGKPLIACLQRDRYAEVRVTGMP
jgi:outer membrane protein OmpA-like peptidoglycan-associated protein